MPQAETRTSCLGFHFAGELAVSDGNDKLIRPNGEFWVNGELLGRGRWISPDRFTVFVERWGDLWWVGEMTDYGLDTITVTSKAEIQTVQPTHFEPYVVGDAPIDVQRTHELVVSDGNVKRIAPDGEFVVNGQALGKGQWISPTRFVVFVSQWGDRWWIGEMTPEGMKTTTVLSRAETADVAPDHLEEVLSGAVGAPCTRI